MVPWAHMNLPSSSTQTASRSVQPFCWVHDTTVTNRQTDTQTDRATPPVAIGRIATAAMPPNNSVDDNDDDTI